MRTKATVRWVASLCFWAALVSGAHADNAHADAALNAQVQSLLTAGVEPGGAHDKIAALGEAGERALRHVFEDTSVQRFVRLRALSVLASFNTAATARYFESLVQAARTKDATLDDLHPARSPLVLRRALDVLRELAPLLRPQPALPTAEAVTSCLSHPDAHVRKAAAALLATLDGPAQIDRALTNQLTHERSRMVRASVERALTSRSARLTAPR